MSDLESSSRIEERSVIKFLVAEQCKLREIFKRMSAVYEETYFSQKHVYRRTKLFKDEKMLSIKTSQEDL